MNVDARTMARARIALREAARGYLFDRNVSLIDFGYPEHDGRIAEDELAIRIHVKQKYVGAQLEAAEARGLTRRLPESIAGFPVDVPEGRYRPQRWFWWGGSPPPASQWARRADPLHGGISISDENHHTYGTLGGLVIDRTSGVEMILSNWHVLVAAWGAQPGQRIYQPGRLDGGTRVDTIAALSRDAMSVGLDAAVAELTGERRLINDQLELGAVTGAARPALGMRVKKSGRGSRLTVGRVTAIEGIARMTYGFVERVIRNVVTIEPRTPGTEVSAAGDSGAWWLDDATMEAVGLHFAGSNSPERALALDMLSVLEALDVEIVTARELAVRPEAVVVSRARVEARSLPSPAHALATAPEGETGLPEEETPR